MLNLHGIASDDEIAEVINAGHNRACFSFECAFAPAHDTLVGFQLHSGTVSLPDGMYDTPGLTGGERSRLNVARLDSLRLLDVLKAPSTQIITDIRWLQAAGLTIEREFQTAWHTGQAGSLLASDPVIIVGSQTGGVWVVNHYPQAIPIVGSHPATPLSNEWDDPDVTCLAYAPGVTHQFYAGTIGGHIFLVELQPVLGGMEPKRSTAIPFWGGQILQIIVLEGLRRIVTAGYGGVWWSDIPSLPSDASGYSWHQVGPGGTFSGLAEGSDQSVVVSAWGHDDTMSTHGIFRGQWQGQDLVFSRSPISGTDETKMMKTSLTSCAGNRSVLYCSATALDESILAILTSQNGGASWTTVNAPGPGLSGFQGTHNNVIAVSPFRSNVVALGWRTGGPFISIDSGLSWSHPHSDLDNVHLHSDHQALCFNRNTPDEDWVFAGSDGGVVYTRDGGQTYVSQYSKQLHILQVYANTLAASSRFPGLIAVGTQDNGNIFSNTREEAARWHTLGACRK